MRGKWICKGGNTPTGCPVYLKRFHRDGAIKTAVLSITATGVYVAKVNGTRVSFPLAPGADSYRFRIREQRYDITEFLQEENELEVVVGSGWYRWMMNSFHKVGADCSLWCEVELVYQDGRVETIGSDESWDVFLGSVVESDIYNGEEYDTTMALTNAEKASVTEITAPRVYEPTCEIREQEILQPVAIFTTPKGEKVVDFGQNLTGYVEFTVTAKAGERIVLSHAEELDKDGNFYTENYRSAKALLTYTCKDGEQTYKPLLTFYGFRYIRLDEYPLDSPIEFRAIVVHSDLRRTGRLSSGNPLLNKLCENIVWGQKGNFLDMPTDCPQRDERVGWTGDAQVFCRAANYNYDCEDFFVRWLTNLRFDQKAVGVVSDIVPNFGKREDMSAAWSDAATVCPWEIYRAYGNEQILIDSFESMKMQVDTITARTKEAFLWIAEDNHFGDWLGLDAPAGSYTGSSDKTLIASAFYAYSTELLVRAGKIIGKDVSSYEELYENIRNKILKTFSAPKTQTECALLLKFNLTDEKGKVAKKLVELIEACGNHLQTGFVGTPYLLHALSENGYAEKAYELLLREEFPSWIYSVKQGATTVWEHWDGKNEKGEFWSKDMNSFNHYAYGAVADWMYGVAGGITPLTAGYQTVKIAPVPSKKLPYFKVEYLSRQGKIRSEWTWVDGKIRYEIETPVDALVVLDGKEYNLKKGVYTF